MNYSFIDNFTPTDFVSPEQSAIYNQNTNFNKQGKLQQNNNSLKGYHYPGYVQEKNNWATEGSISKSVLGNSMAPTPVGELFLSKENINRVQKMIVKKMLQSGVDAARASVAVLGITFKENCPDIRNSKVVDLIRELESWNLEVKVSDPWADPSLVLKENQVQLETIGSDSNVDCLIVAVGHDEYRNLPPNILQSYFRDNKTGFLADLKGIFDRRVLSDLGFKTYRL